MTSRYATPGLRGLGPATATSYEARLKHLWTTAERLRPIGQLLEDFGSLAPPCVARPYTVMREKLVEATAMLLDAIQTRSTPEEFAAFEKLSGGPGSLGLESNVGPKAAIQSLPVIKSYWKDAPSKWQGMMTTPIPGMGGLAGLGDADAESYALSLMDASAATKKAPTTSMARRALAGARQAWNSKWFRVVRPVGRIFDRVLTVTFVAYFAWEGARKLYNWIWSEDPPPPVANKVDEAIAFYNADFLPEVSQQYKGMLLAAENAKGNPVKLIQEMLAIDPWSLTPVPPMGSGDDEGVWGSGLPRKRTGDPWLAGGILLGGSGLILAAARDA